MTEQDKLRIEESAKSHADKYTINQYYYEGIFDGYVDGATAEHERMAELLKEQIELVSTREAEQDVMAADTVRLMDQIEYQKKALKEDYDKITKLEFGLKEEKNKVIDECLEIIAYERQKYVSGATLVVNILVPIRERIESLKSQ